MASISLPQTCSVLFLIVAYSWQNHLTQYTLEYWLFTPTVMGYLGPVFAASAQHHTRAPYQIPAAWEQINIQNLKFGFYLMHIAFSPSWVKKKSLSRTIISQATSVIRQSSQWRELTRPQKESTLGKILKSFISL